jgi:hypothetical protein
MNPLDDQLDRLLRAAALRHESVPIRPAYGLETRALAAWRSSAGDAVWGGGVLVRGLVLASLIMGVSLWTALTQKGNPDSDYLQLADSTVQTDYP